MLQANQYGHFLTNPAQIRIIHPAFTHHCTFPNKLHNHLKLKWEIINSTSLHQLIWLSIKDTDSVCKHPLLRNPDQGSNNWRQCYQVIISQPDEYECMNSSEWRKECHWLPAHLSFVQQARQSQRLPFQWSAANGSFLQSNPHPLRTAPSPQRSARHLNALPKWGRKKDCCFNLLHLECMIYFLPRSSLEDILNSVVTKQLQLVLISCIFLTIQWKSIGTRNCLKENFWVDIQADHLILFWGSCPHCGRHCALWRLLVVEEEMTPTQPQTDQRAAAGPGHPAHITLHLYTEWERDTENYHFISCLHALEHHKCTVEKMDGDFETRHTERVHHLTWRNEVQ